MALFCKHLVLHAPNWLGDAIMAQPAMRSFVLESGAERITLTGRSWLADVLPWLNLPGTTYSPVIPPDADTCVLFPNSFRSAWQAMRSGCQRRIGYRGQWRSLLLSDALSPRVDMLSGHHREYYNDLARLSGLTLAQAEVQLACPPDAVQHGRQWLNAHGLEAQRTACIAPGAQFGGAKRYPAERWAAVAHSLAGRGFDLLALGTPAERDIAGAVLKDCPGRTYNAAGETTLGECLGILSAARGLLCNDSGLMHVAAGMGREVVTVFGATDPVRTAPSGANVHLIYHPADCSPCLQRECSVPGQPCMANVDPAEVAAAFNTDSHAGGDA